MFPTTTQTATILTRAQISTPAPRSIQATKPITDSELMEYLNKWRTVADVARAFSGWYNINDVRRFVSYLDRQYRQNVLGYAETISDREERLYFAVMVWLNKRIVEGEYSDALGELYMAVGYPNRDTGQFFTPYPVARMMAEINMPVGRPAALEIARSNPEGKLIVSDPACGSGSMLCAAWEVSKNRGYDDLVAFYGQDIDPYCVVMTRINMIMRRELIAVQQTAQTLKAIAIMDKFLTNSE